MTPETISQIAACRRDSAASRANLRRVDHRRRPRRLDRGDSARRTRLLASWCSKKRAIRAFTSASRCCPPICRCSSGSAWPSRFAPSAWRSGVRNSSRPYDGRRQEFEFAQAWNKSLAYAYQVRRSEFDEILIRRAASAGAEVIEGCRARAVEILESGRGVRVHAVHDDGRVRVLARGASHRCLRPRYVPGRRSCGSKRRNKKHNSAAMYAHFTGARREPGKREGNIAIYWFDHGWFWFIPLADGATSVGAVVWPKYMKSRSVDLREFFLSTIALCPPLAQRLDRGEPGHGRRGDGQLLLRLRSLSRSELSAGGRCLRIRRPCLLIGGDARDEQRRGGRGDARRLPQAPGTAPPGPSGASSASRVTARSNFPGSSIASPTRRCANCSWAHATSFA